MPTAYQVPLLGPIRALREFNDREKTDVCALIAWYELSLAESPVGEEEISKAFALRIRSWLSGKVHVPACRCVDCLAFEEARGRL